MKAYLPLALAAAAALCACTPPADTPAAAPPPNAPAAAASMPAADSPLAFLQARLAAQTADAVRMAEGSPAREPEFARRQALSPAAWEAERAAREAVLYTPELAALMARDRAANGADSGRLDFDPLCLCSDLAQARFTDQAVRSDTSDRATLSATRTVGQDVVALRWEMRRTPAGWRIDDVAAAEETYFPAAQTLRAYLAG